MIVVWIVPGVGMYKTMADAVDAAEESAIDGVDARVVRVNSSTGHKQVVYETNPTD